MGFAASVSATRSPDPQESRAPVSVKKNPTSAVKSVSPSSEAAVLRMPGKEKYIIEPGAVAMEDYSVRGGASSGTLILFCAPVTEEFTISYRAATGAIFARRYTNEELQTVKDSIAAAFPWGSFFKSLASDTLKYKATVQTLTPHRCSVSFTIVNSKEPDTRYPLTCALDLVGSEHAATFEYFVEPMTRLVQAVRRGSTSHSQRVERIECDTITRTAAARQCKRVLLQNLTIVRPLREAASEASLATMELLREVRSIERQIRILREPQKRHPLDELYEKGGAQYFEHAPMAEKHYPMESDDINPAILQCIRATFPLELGASLDGIGSVLNRADLHAVLADCREEVKEIFEIFRGIDRWDFDVIQLDMITNGNALFYTTYVLLYKLDLVASLGLDDAVLQRFLLAVQASYHPNPYHNAMHAADVTHVNYYIMLACGLNEKCQLSKEELFASILATAIHDFDHPGLNNNFHTRTNAYLSTLYNDRSILENHHVACAFELMCKPEYNLLAPLNEDQQRTVRDTMIDVVLATDMGNHGRIFKDFQVRMAQTTDWQSDKESVRLALSMSVKMADISNCARPSYIYSEWARRIAQEFYNQGDVESTCQLSISPFMDRSKEAVDFPKGQISFMMYIVIPMVEALSDFLPSFRFALQYCHYNKEMWQNYMEGG